MSKHPKPSLQHDAEHETPDNRRAPVFLYMTILFAAAFLLLLLSYFMEARSNQAHVETLTDSSTTAIRSLETILEQQDALQEEVFTLTDQLEDLEIAHQSEIADLENQLDTLQAQLTQSEQALEALDWLSQMEALYAQGEDEALLLLMEEFKAAGLSEFLPSSSLHMTEGAGYSAPIMRYWELQQAMAEEE